MRLLPRCCLAALLSMTVACSPQPAGEPPPDVIPVPADLGTARHFVERIDASLGAWQSAETELVDYTGDGGKMVFWYANETVRKIEATLPGKAAQAHWQVYYTSAQRPFFAVYRETPAGRDAVDAGVATTSAFAFLKDKAMQVPADGASSTANSVSLDEVRAFGLQLVQSVHQR